MSPEVMNREVSTTLRDSLDPSDWEEYRAVAHRMLDRMLDHHRDIAQGPAWRPVPAELEARFREAAPLEGIGAEAAYRDFLELVLPYPTGNGHPRFWGWVCGTGSPSGMVAEMLAAGLNSNAGEFDDAAARVESQLIEWIREALGYPSGASGVMTSGASVANLIGLAAARDANGDGEIAQRGVRRARGRLVLYASSETHSSIYKAVQLLGLGREAVRTIPVGADYRLQTAALEAAIARDRERGERPFAVVANACTVNTGATDDLVAIADIAEREGLWLHVDGAIAALVRLSTRHRAVVRGIERADSLAFDFHKWMYVPYEAGCVLVRDREAHRRPFAVAANYLSNLPRGIAAYEDMANLRSPQLSRGFNALKVWLLIKEHGLGRFGRLIDRNIAQARYLVARIEGEAELELLAPAPLNIVCFRYVSPELGGDDTNELNRELLMRLQEDGVAVPSSTVLDGRFALRVANTNQRSRRSDFDLLIEHVLRLGRKLAAEIDVGRNPAAADDRVTPNP